MADPLMDVGDVRRSHERWQDHNRRGLAFAAAADWVEASDAFAAAAAALADDPTEPTPHEPLALVLGNLAQACFRSGRAEEALSHAQRACALRVALTGEDSMSAARARMDFAVMLATAGRRDEAMQLVQRAIAAVENHVGEEDPRLTVVLENAARIALSAGAAGSAEPFLLRLHALLSLHEESTQSADHLLARIAEVRAMQAAPPRLPDDTIGLPEVPEEAPASAPDMPDMPEVEASFDTTGEWDDQPLRDAVALTDVLLRTTPSGVPAIPDRAQVDTADLTPLSYSLSEPAPADEEPAAPLVLEFSVQHGLIDDEYLSNSSATPTLDLVDPPTAEPPADEAVVDIVHPVVVAMEVDTTIGAPSTEEVPIAEMPVLQAPITTAPSASLAAATPSRGMAVVLPTPNSGSRAFDSSELPDHASPPSSPFGDTREKPASSGLPWLPLGGGVAAVAAAAAWWFFLR
ncbi:MAG TPA: tetratricopeptide repeat protein [Gemmatimonas aurantiaca]|nr:tetratricopeptide repeat protein [Gemmatimonas aurantiaca]HCT57457.1 tetratricopeptide repeat protein [Gemmatimonas aurantiaca]